jgi:hypothetical protein
LRKYLGVWLSMAALCAMSWAQAPGTTAAPAQTPADSSSQTSTQAPAQTPAQSAGQVPAAEAAPTVATANKITAPAIQYPRYEFFGGGTYAEAGLFNAGHWAGLYGWDASLGLNATHWLGVIFDGGQYFGTSKIPTAVPTPFPSCPPFCPSTTPTFGVATREYNFLFGLQFSRRKREGWTPFGELMYGHQGTRGQVVAQGETFTEVSSGRALVAGGGLDRKINERFALRLKADYLQTGSFRQKQDNFRFSVGVVIKNVHKKKRTLEDETQVEP